MHTEIKQKLIEYVNKTPDQEVCGFLYTNFNTINFLECDNIAIDKKKTFEISQNDFLKAENSGRIVGIFHSHVEEDSDFSENDKILSSELDIPIFCYSNVDKKMQEFRPKGYKVKLLQNEFIRGHNDCYSLIRDYYWNNFEYLLDDFDRDDNFENSNSSIMLDSYEKQGFFVPENQIDIKEHDLILSKSIKCAYPHHIEVFIGNSRVLQHLKNRLSGKELLTDGLYKKRCKILRFKDFSLKRNISIV